MVFSGVVLLVCTWRHGGHVGDQEQKHFSPLGTKLYLNVNSSRKTSIVLTPNMAAPSRGCNFSSPVLTIAPSIQRIFCFFFSFYFPFYFVNETAACVLFCALLTLPSRAVCQEGPYDPTSRWQRELQKKKGLEGKTTNLHVYHFFIHFFAASAGLRFGGVEASPPQKNAPPPPNIVIMTANK